MDFVLPTTITDAMLVSSDVPENDYQEWVMGNAYVVGDKVQDTSSGVHKNYQCLVSQGSGLTADLLNEDCSDISDWTKDDNGTAVSEVSPFGQFRFDTNAGTPFNFQAAQRSRIIASPPGNFSLEVKIYLDAIGLSSNLDYAFLRYENTTWQFYVTFSSDHFYVLRAGQNNQEIASNILKYNTVAAFQTIRFQVDKTTESAATVEVFVKEEGEVFVSKGKFDCDNETTSGVVNGRITFGQGGCTAINRVSHLDYIKVGTGLGAFETINSSPVNNSDWLDLGSTNRWKLFDGTIGNQTTQATSMSYVFNPGNFDSIGLLNIDATSVRVTLTPLNLINENGDNEINEDGTNAITDTYDETFDVTGKTNFTILDIPYPPNSSSDGTVTITIANSGGTEKVGELIIGMKTYIGILCADPKPGFGTDNYSTTTTDVYGHMTIVPRSFRKWMTGTVHIANIAGSIDSNGKISLGIDVVSHLLDLYLNIPLLWVFDTNFSVLINYGFWESTGSSMGISHTDLALTIKGIV